MDTSETYVKMCEKAVEIQHQTPKSIYVGSKPGSFFYSRYVSRIVNAEYAQNPETVIWLPRQDQLQEMVRGEYKDIKEMIHDFGPFLTYQASSLASLEIVWLEFVMKIKYGKVWSGEDWVKDPA